MGLIRLSPLDASFLHLETRNAYTHIGGLGIFERGGWLLAEERFAALRHHVEARLDVLPRYRQKVAMLPFNLDDPLLLDDQKFNLDFHLRRAAVPRPGGDAELARVVEEIFSRPLDRARPLWEMYCIEGLKDGRWGLLTKAHHSMVDGISVMELATLLLDSNPDYVPPPAVTSWRPSPPRRPLDLLMDTAKDRAVEARRQLRSAVDDPVGLARTARTLADGVGGLRPLARSLFGQPSPLNGPLSATRAYRFSRFRLSDFKDVKQVFQATINDVVLGVVTGGIRKYLQGRQVDVTGMQIRALCPMSIRPDSARAALGNQLSALIVDLPVGEPYPAARMRKVKASVERIKQSGLAAGADILQKLAGGLPAPIHPLVAIGLARQAGTATLITNIPGPQLPLYALGCEMVEAMPVALLYEGQRLAIAILSYAGNINFGYLADGDAVADLDELGRCMERSLQELLNVARSARTDYEPVETRRKVAVLV